EKDQVVGPHAEDLERGIGPGTIGGRSVNRVIVPVRNAQGIVAVRKMLSRKVRKHTFRQGRTVKQDDQSTIDLQLGPDGTAYVDRLTSISVDADLFDYILFRPNRQHEGG